MRFLRRKRVIIPAIAGVLALVGAGVAYAYYTSQGGGSGSAKAGTVQTLTISQIGPGYDSLIPSNTYSQDQTTGGDGPQEFGNGITLSTAPNAVELVNVVVAIDNWGAAETDVPMTLWIPGSDTPGGAALSDTQYFNFAAQTNSDTPSETNVTFDFSSQQAYVDSTLVYGITFNTTADVAPVTAADSLNIALSSSATDLSVGADTVPGTVWMDDIYGNNNDFPTCTTGLPTSPASTLVSIVTDCGPYNPLNPGAYGTPAEVAAGSADIPAVEVNVVGGSTPPLYPGTTQAFGFAITNPNPGSVYVNDVTITVPSDGSGNVLSNPTDSGSGVSGCSASWFSINGSPAAIDGNVATGTTLYQNAASISMSNPNTSQDACEGASVGLTFTSD
jgi:hypothetical protein